MPDPDHFAPEQWVDYVRDISPIDCRREIDSHLASGCRECTNAYRDWTMLRETAAGTSASAPPDEAVSLARALFTSQRKPGVVARAVDAVKVLFDSQLMPAAAGVRAAGSVQGRKVLYATGDFLVDLHIEALRASDRTLVIGQVVDANEPRRGVHDVPVVLLRDLLVLGKARTNACGEFSVEFEGPSQDLSVALGLRQEGAVVWLGTPRLRS